jgi:predicted DNA-binding protein with PD1-like motif
MESRQTESGYLVRLVPGEEVIGSLTGFLKRHAVTSGALSGIGALTDVELGYFQRRNSIYIRRVVHGEWELLSLTGNVSRAEGEPFVHAHVVLSDEQFQMTGGHLFRAVVTVTAEIVVNVWRVEIERALDPRMGLRALCLDPDPPASVGRS